MTLAAVVFIVQSSAPPLSPAEAAAIVARLDSPTNMTHYVVAPTPEYPRPPVVIVKQPLPRPTNVVDFRPLNCCDKYVIHVPRERRKR